MKKIIVLFSLVAFFCFTAVPSFAQKTTPNKKTETVQKAAQNKKAEPVQNKKVEPEQSAKPELEQVAKPEQAVRANSSNDETVDSQPFHQVLKQKFIEGGAGWMAPILIVLILGLALVIERIIYLNMATTNTQRLL